VSKLQSSEDVLYILRTKASELRQPIDPVKRENPNAISAEYAMKSELETMWLGSAPGLVIRVYRLYRKM
jgi:hypothetical protein